MAACNRDLWSRGLAIVLQGPQGPQRAILQARFSLMCGESPGLGQLSNCQRRREETYKRCLRTRYVTRFVTVLGG